LCPFGAQENTAGTPIKRDFGQKKSKNLKKSKFAKIDQLTQKILGRYCNSAINTNN